MKKLFYSVLTVVMFTFVGVVFAQDLILTKIGSLSAVGVDYSNVEYSGAIPTLEGTASPSAIVYIKIKTSTDLVVAATPSGVWEFTPGVLDPGANTIEITSGIETLSFTLNYNATPAAEVTPTPIPEELPAAGIWEYYLPIIGMGLTVVFFGKFLKGKMLSWEGKKNGL